MNRELLKYITCPSCQRKFHLEISEAHGTEIIKGRLNCRCGRSYPIIKGVPRILQDELLDIVIKKYNVKVGRSSRKRNDRETVSKKKTLLSFGHEWKNFCEAHKDYYEQFLDWIKPFTIGSFKGKEILDAGCGTGIHSYFMGRAGGRVIGIDLSEAVDVAYKKNIKIKHNHIIQTDIFMLPFKKKFDFIFCNGVLHHLPDPEKGLQSLVKCLKKSGYLYLKVYSREGNLFTIYFIEKFLKKITRILPKDVLLFLCGLSVPIFNLLLYLIYLPINKIKILKKISRTLPYNNYFIYISKFSFRHKQNIIYDIMSAPEVHYFSEPMLRRMLKNLKIISMKGKDVLSWRVISQKA